MPRPAEQGQPENCPPDQATHLISGPESIPRISHDQRHGAASGGIWLHGPETSQGRQSIPELVILLVAGVGFEPT